MLLLTGGDDQALCLTLLQLSCGSSGSSGATRASNGGSPASSTACSCTELVRLPIPCAHSSALRSVWLQQPTPATASPACSATAAAEPTQLGAVAFSLGLDQQVRCWQIRVVQQPGLQVQQQQRRQGHELAAGMAGGAAAGPPFLLEAGDAQADAALFEDLPWMDAACYSASSSGGTGEQWRLEAREVGCRYTQVVEPAALDVVPPEAHSLPAECGGHFLVGVAGRGTEVLPWCMPGPMLPK